MVIKNWTLSYHCGETVFKASASGLAGQFPAKYRVDRVKKAGLSCANLTNQKDVCRGDIGITVWCIMDDIFLEFEHRLCQNK